jgi:hypothetical protein
LWKPAIIAGVLMALSFVRALSWRLINQHSDDLRLTPRGEHLLIAAALSVPLFPAVALLWSAITRRLRTRLTVVLVLMVVLGAAGGFAALVAWVPLFNGKYVASVTSPDRTREAHVWVDGLLGCRASLYVSDHGGLWGAFAQQRNVDCDSIGAQWLADGGVEISAGEPRPLNLFFGPH